MVEKVKNSKTHRKNIPNDAYCCWHVGDEGRRPNFSLWAEFQPIPWWGRKYLIVKNNWDVAENNGRNGEERKNSPSKHTHCCLLSLTCHWRVGNEGRRQTSVCGLSFGRSGIETVIIKLSKNNWDVAENYCTKDEGRKNSPSKHTHRCLLLLACWQWGQEAKLQSVGWVMAILVLGQQLFNCKKITEM